MVRRLNANCRFDRFQGALTPRNRAKNVKLTLNRERECAMRRCCKFGCLLSIGRYGSRTASGPNLFMSQRKETCLRIRCYGGCTPRGTAYAMATILTQV